MMPRMWPVLADVPATFWFPPQASTFAKEVDDFYFLIYYICLAFFIPIVIGMVLFVIWYRRRPGYEGSSLAWHNNLLEVTWTVVPTLIVVWIFVRGTEGYLDMMRPPNDTIDINVTARKWAWTFQYPNGAISDELHIPVNKAIRLRMRSDDVLHAFFVPAFRCKSDVVPGRVTTMWFQAILTGDFDLYCAEYCGEKHSNMLGLVRVHEEAEYKKWVEEANKPPTGDPVKHGLWLYNRVGCKGCHSLEENKVVVGPSFSKSFGSEQQMFGGGTQKVDEQYIRTSILEPQKQKRAGFERASQMQSYQGKLKDDEIAALTALIQSLKDGGPPPVEGK
ncbi:MAG: cytochrome c oxidase subunit II [Pirellulaceae bacterium]|nr:cytochrome c oxidase subunit II [Pirellulaceae bacterium]